MVPYLISKGGIPMYKQLKEHFNCYAFGINIACNKCGKINFVGTDAMDANHVCDHCGGEIQLSEQSKRYLRAMIVQVKNLK